MKFKLLASLLTFAALACAPFAALAQDSTIKSSNVYRYAGVPASGTSEIDTLTIQSGTSALIFTLTVTGGRTTAPITWSATDATLIARIDAAVEALSAVGVGGVVTAAGTGSSGIGTYTLTFAGKNAKQDFPALTLTEVSRTGGTSATISTTTAGVAATWKDAPTGTIIINSSTGAVYSNTGTTPGDPTWTLNPGLAVATSADLAAVLSDETGTGLAVFGTGPTLGAAIVTPKTTAITGDGAITIASGVVTLSKGSAAAITLAAPSSQNGTRITVVSLTDFAHVITVTGGCWDGTATTNTTLTFSAVRGASCTLIANGTAWYVESLNAVVPAP